MKVSIIIVTRNRASDLEQTLASLLLMRVPAGGAVDIMVVDNGSTDHTTAVVAKSQNDGLAVRLLTEPNPGKSRGLNRAIAETKADILLFTDDDVRVPPNWLEAMTAPIVAGTADVVVGGVDLAPHLLRPWMTPAHRSWLASSELLENGQINSLIGANMAVTRSAVETVGGFDPELGPGALGFCDDGLLAGQLKAADFRFTSCFDVRIEHHPDPNRLLRSSWLNAAERHGHSHAYRGHHWEHWNCRFGAWKVFVARRKLASWRKAHPDHVREEGCDMEELGLAFNLGVATGHLRESVRPRHYAKHGVRRIR